MNKNLAIYLTRYFDGLSVPRISKDEAKILIKEIIRLIEILEQDPEISYKDLWTRIHN